MFPGGYGAPLPAGKAGGMGGGRGAQHASRMQRRVCQAVPSARAPGSEPAHSELASPPMAMCSENEQEVSDMPQLTVNVSMLGGHACSIHLPSTSTVWVLKSKLKAALGIPKRQQVVLVGGEMAPISRAL